MAYLANLLVPQTSLAEVRRRLSEVMEEDGYEQLQRAVLFPHDNEEDVRFFLISKGAEVMVLGSGYRDEMVYIHTRFSAESLLLWQRHGPWGVLGRSREAERGRFENRKSGRFRNRVPDGNVEWLARAVKQFSSAEEWGDFRSCLRYGRWFTDRAVGEFCQGLGLPLAALSYDEMEQVWDGSLEARQVEGWTIQLLAFRRKPEAGPKPMLESGQEEEDEDYSMLQCLILVSLVMLFIYLFGIVMLLIVPLLIFGLMFAFITPVIRQLWVGQGQRVRCRFLSAVKDRFSNPIQLSAGGIHNRTHRCSAMIPAGIQAKTKLSRYKPQDFRKHSLVFDFKLGDLLINATAHKPKAQHEFPSTFSRRKEECRAEFQAGPYPGTRLFYLMQTGASVWYHYDWFIYTPQAVYRFRIVGNKEPVSEEITSEVDELVRSFEIQGD